MYGRDQACRLTARRKHRASSPTGLQRYEVSFFTGLHDLKPVYVVYYDYKPALEQGYIYPPGRDTHWFNLDCGTICRGDGFEGNWFPATQAWEKAVRPVIVSAKMLPAN